MDSTVDLKYYDLELSSFNRPTTLQIWFNFIVMVSSPMTTSTAQALANIAFNKYWANAYASTWILSIQISRLQSSWKRKTLVASTRAQSDWWKELLSIQARKSVLEIPWEAWGNKLVYCHSVMQSWQSISISVGDIWDWGFWFLCHHRFSDSNPASKNTLAMPRRLSHAPRNQITNKYPMTDACSCVWANFCDSCPIETRHYSPTVSSYFLSWCIPIRSSDILAHSFQGTLALYNLPRYGSSYDQCSKDGLPEIVRKSNLLFRLIKSLELHSNLH